MMMASLIVALCHTHALAAAPPSTKAEAEAEVKAVRQEYEAVKKASKALRKTTMTIGGGQNAHTIRVLYAGGTDADYEKDPYASPFHLRQVRVEKVLPAVGEASVELTFDKKGALVFAYTTGSDFVGASAGFDLTPTDELRVYFHEGQPFRAVWTGLQTDGKAVTVDVFDKDGGRVRGSGAALASYATEVSAALATLAR